MLMSFIWSYSIFFVSCLYLQTVVDLLLEDFYCITKSKIVMLCYKKYERFIRQLCTFIAHVKQNIQTKPLTSFQFYVRVTTLMTIEVIVWSAVVT